MDLDLPMSSNTVLVLAVTVAAAAFLLMLLARKPGAGGKKKTKKRRRGRKFDFVCKNCQKALVLTRRDLERVPPTESGLMVSQDPSLVGRPLGECDCPHCGTTHYFCIDKKPPEYALTGAFVPQRRSNLCAQCHEPLENPAWELGKFDHQVAKAPKLTARHGLVCSRCEAITCVECCSKTSKGRTKDGSFLCPRCNRGPVVVFHHF